jgi:hypothetical protein
MVVPARIGRYPVTGVLGQGSMGIVYRGRDESLDREVALKVMSTEGADPDGHARFRREALAAARLQHPNIVTIYELGEHDGRPFIAMELLEGLDLRDAIEAGLRPDPRMTLPLVLQVLAGLGHAHEHGVVHRDVKPSNVFLPQGRPAKLMDFGVARLSGGGTTAGTIVGTPNYMSPEQVTGAPVDNRSDLFSTGLILYELVTGERAFVADSVVAVLYKIAHETPDLGLLPREAPWRGLRVVLERSLERSPEDRYATAEAMTADLAAALVDLGGSTAWATMASPQGVPRPRPGGRSREPDGVRPTVPPPGQREEHQEPPFRPNGRHVVLGLTLGAVVLVGGILGGLAWMQIRRTPAPQAETPRAGRQMGSTGTDEGAIALKREARPTITPADTPRAVALAPTTPHPAPATTAGSVAATPRAPQPRSTATPAATDEPTPPAAPRGDINTAEALLEQRHYRSALDEARAVLEREPSNKEAQAIAEDAEAALVVEERLEKARAALGRGDRDTALDEVRGGLAVAPNDARLMALFRELTR